MKRKMVFIDEEKCDGCGECVPSCAEGAIRIIDGKARLISDRFCDGLGACLGHCPQGAIRIEEREADPFDEAAVAAHLASGRNSPAPMSGCPSARLLNLSASVGRPGQPVAGPAPQLGALSHWPIQLHLLPPTAPFIKGADLLICATCVPVALPDFHSRLLAGRTIAIACPKLDNQTGYLEKLAGMIASAELRSLTVARMSVPCCTGLVRLVHQARDVAGSSLPITEIVVGHDGQVTIKEDEARPPVQSLCHGTS